MSLPWLPTPPRASLVLVQMLIWSAALLYLAMWGEHSLLAVAFVIAILSVAGARGNIEIGTYLVRHVDENILAGATSIGGVVALSAAAVGPHAWRNTHPALRTQILTASRGIGGSPMRDGVYISVVGRARRGRCRQSGARSRPRSMPTSRWPVWVAWANAPQLPDIAAVPARITLARFQVRCGRHNQLAVVGENEVADVDGVVSARHV